MSNVESQQNLTCFVNQNTTNNTALPSILAASPPLSDKKQQQNKGVTLTEHFYINVNRGRRRHLKLEVELNERGLSLRHKSINHQENVEQLICIGDIVGSRCSSCLDGASYGNLSSCTRINGCVEQDQHNDNKLLYNESKVSKSAYLHIYAYVRKEQPLRRLRTVQILKFCSFPSYEENLKAAELWHHSVRLNKQYYLGMSSHIEQKTLLILLNPKSGPGKGRQLFQNYVIPVLNEADVQYELIVTAHANYARELIKHRQDLLERYSGIVVASGDGLFHEVINGLMEHRDWQNLTRCLPLGIIPCGSGNGLAKSIAHYCNEPYEPNPIVNSTLACISGMRTSLDVVRVELIKNANATQMYSFLSVGWGFIADIDIESERLRTFGSQRFALWSVYRLLHLKTYKGKLSYLPCYQRQQQQQQQQHQQQRHIKLDQTDNLARDKESLETFQDTLDDDNNMFCDILLDDDEQFVDALSQISPESAKGSLQSRRTNFYSIDDHSTNSIRNLSINKIKKMEIDKIQSESISLKTNLPSINSPVPDTWYSEDGEYIMVHAANTTHLAADCFFAPESKLNDGIIYLVIIRAGISRAQLLKFLLNLNSGTHLSAAPTNHLEIVPVKAFRIEPHDSDGIITVDGEKVEYGALQAEIMPGLIQVMVSNIPIK